MRLTSQLISNAPTLINPEGQFTIQLRNLKIPYIENLGITQDKFDVIDLTNNEIVELSNIPLTFKKLGVLLLANNNISTIDRLKELPNLSSISLVNNNIHDFKSLVNLTEVLNLTNLSLLNNPVTSLNDYRLFVIWLLPSLKILDFNKVKQKERIEATEKFGSSLQNANELARSLLKQLKANVSESADKAAPSKEQRQLDHTINKLTDEERVKLLHDLENADSIDEIERIEAALKNGFI